MGGKHQEYLYFFFARNLAIETGKQHQTSNTNLKTSLILNQVKSYKTDPGQKLVFFHDHSHTQHTAAAHVGYFISDGTFFASSILNPH